ncbi:hypothetical protein [Polynucleobacter asymbioticus]|uniref:Uncharacterized protein n=1 Tax=Polynucleobacter asymbioticus TaxID=576611 RepID=A0AAC9NIX9_9BURK|nr:hypothetical protein [Polynucleobacter asymbioticus]APC01319.1 hypothetical protein AOC25_06695 [Polynucleobacter asymbioticus]
MATGNSRQIQTEAFPFIGGLDLMTPALEIPAGACISAQNFEPSINGGYRRMYGYERYNGMQQPNSSAYSNVTCTLTGPVYQASTIVGASSGATAYVLQVNGTTELIVTAITGTFVANETLNVSGSGVGIIASVAQNAGQTPLLHANYLSLAATYYRSLISPVPGINPVRGVWYYNGFVYAFRDNAVGNACNMYRAFTGSNSTVTITISSPGVVTWNNHQFPPGQKVVFTTTGALPTGISAGTTYYVVNPTSNTFQLSATVGGSAITTSGTQSGIQTATGIAGWNQVTFGQEIQFAQYQANVTISITTSAVISWTNHGLSNGQAVAFTSTGSLPTGMAVGMTYYVIAATTNTFQISATLGGTAITTTGSQSGTQTCTVISNTIASGTVVTGQTSGATATIQRVLLRTGTWSAAPIGSLVFDNVNGTFITGEALKIAGQPMVVSTTGNTAITLQPGGRYVFNNYSFTGSINNFYMYFCDGVNFLQEFDGYRLVPIRTGIQGDSPTQITCWENMLVCSVSSSIQVSGIGAPYSWTALTGAAELAIGDVCTGMLPLTANQSSGGSLAIFTGSPTSSVWNTYILYGSSTANFQLVLTNPGAGSAPYCARAIGDGYYLDTKGIVKMSQTQAYGNFEMSTLTRAIQPIIDSHRGMATASCIVRASNQLRIFFNDGTGVILYIKGKQTATINGDILTTDAADIMLFDMSQGGTVYFNTVESFLDNTGIERVFASGSTGFVYEMERGSSFDGYAINSLLLMSFNSSKTPRNIKHYHRTILQSIVQVTAQVSVGYDLDYGAEVDSESRNSSMITQTGALWDQNNWDSGTWDSPYVNDYTVDTPGNGRNLALLIYANNAIDYPYTIQSMISHYSIGRLER